MVSADPSLPGQQDRLLFGNGERIEPAMKLESNESNPQCCGRSKFAITLFVMQTIFLVFFGLFAEYDYGIGAPKTWFYPMFQNVHVMMFIGFGFLMTFLKKYGFSAISVNFLIASTVIQWHIIVKGLIHLMEINKAPYTFGVNLVSLISADFTAAAVLISFGAIIGKTSPLQLLIMAFIEVVVFAANEYIAVEIFHASDVGGSMVVHVFGAYFGLAVARVIYKDGQASSSNESSSYNSDIFSMIGSVFLWLYWPSFNSAVAANETQQMRAIINTYISLASCVLATFAVSSLVDRRARLNMVHVQNATLAGGVAVGTAANFMIQPWGACLIGILAAVLSVVGFTYIQPALTNKIKLHDSCGVNNLHGMPGILAAIVGAVAVAAISTDKYNGEPLGDLFPLMVPSSNVTEAERTASQQAGYQAATLGVTLALALAGGVITGLILRFVPLDQPEESLMFSDEKHFEVPDDFERIYAVGHSQENSETHM